MVDKLYSEPTSSIMSANQWLSVGSLVDMLARKAPLDLQHLRERYPQYTRILEPGRVLGDTEESHVDYALLLDLAMKSIALVKEEAEVALGGLRRRLRASMRLRLGANLVSSMAAAGLMASIFASQKTASIVSAIVTLIASTLSLLAQYFEDFAGGQNALRDLRERLSRNMVELSEADGELRLIVATDSRDELVPLIRKMNTAVANLRQIQVLVRS
jgi:methyl-accepting chemotaxis protein